MAQSAVAVLVGEPFRLGERSGAPSKRLLESRGIPGSIRSVHLEGVEGMPKLVKEKTWASAENRVDDTAGRATSNRKVTEAAQIVEHDDLASRCGHVSVIRPTSILGSR
jgi:hypothetical protein